MRTVQLLLKCVQYKVQYGTVASSLRSSIASSMPYIISSCLISIHMFIQNLPPTYEELHIGTAVQPTGSYDDMRVFPSRIGTSDWLHGLGYNLSSSSGVFSFTTPCTRVLIQTKPSPLSEDHSTGRHSSGPKYFEDLGMCK
jgi:hypothetical protein